MQTQAIYSLRDVFKVRFCGGPLPRGLAWQLEPFRSLSGADEKQTIEIVLGKPPRDKPAAFQHGFYKGIPWQLSKNENRIFFHAPCFISFLLIRMILTPLFKKHTAERGGFTFPGSSFHLNDEVFVLYGPPGCGKTRILLEALERGAVWIGDNELYVTGGRIAPIYDELELRYHTVRKLNLWKRLSLRTRLRLIFFAVIQTLTVGRLSFNVLLRPADVFVGQADLPVSHRITMIHLEGHEPPGRMTPDAFAAGLDAHEKHYRERFGSYFFDGKDLEASIHNRSVFLEHCELWRAPVESPLESILKIREEGSLQ